MANGDSESASPWTRTDGWIALASFAVGLIARIPLVARIEGILDHDQSVVGLMALDIAKGRRFPIFFDGQRYMGAFEAYLASGFVRIFGHELWVIALAPLLVFGVFVAGQYAVWRVWRDQTTGLMAAGLTAVGSPMIALWGIVPRGGYIEVLAWALPAMAIYRAVSRPGSAELSPWRQACWGFLLGLGYLLNPLSLTVYAAIGFDWMLARHGADLRRERLRGVRWIDSKASYFLGPVIVASWILALAFCCHVDPQAAATGLPYIAFGGWIARPWALPAGVLGVVFLLGAAGWWSNGPRRLYRRVIERPWTLLGTVIAFLPFVLHGVLTRLGRLPTAPSLPIWIAAPWRAGANVRTLISALGPLLGADPRVAETVLIGQGVDTPQIRWGSLADGLTLASPVMVAIVMGLIGLVALRDRRFWGRLVALRGEDVAPPTGVAISYLGICLGLFLLQGTSPNGSSVRYLVPVWVVLPGLIASGLRALPRRVATLAMLGLIVPWTVGQVSLWNDLDRRASARPLADKLMSRGTTAIVAPTPVALIVANLSHGSVGAAEFRPIWPRLGERYSSRFTPDRALTCVVDRRFPWKINGEGGWAPEQDLRAYLLALTARHPGRVVLREEIGPFEIWDVDLSLDLVLGKGIFSEQLATRP